MTPALVRPWMDSPSNWQWYPDKKQDCLATVNQVFSFLNPLTFRHVIDQYATGYRDCTHAEFLRGVSPLLGEAVGVAFVSRVARNSQD